MAEPFPPPTPPVPAPAPLPPPGTPATGQAPPTQVPPNPLSAAAARGTAQVPGSGAVMGGLGAVVAGGHAGANPYVTPQAAAPKVDLGLGRFAAGAQNLWNQGQSALTQGAQTIADAKDKVTTAALTARPPLSHYFNLGDDSIIHKGLSAVQGFLHGNPSRTAMGMSALGLAEPVMGLGSLSLPLMAAAHGVLAGGDSGTAAKGMLGPLLDKNTGAKPPVAPPAAAPGAIPAAG